ERRAVGERQRFQAAAGETVRRERQRPRDTHRSTLADELVARQGARLPGEQKTGVRLPERPVHEVAGVAHHPDRAGVVIELTSDALLELRPELEGARRELDVDAFGVDPAND